MVKAEDRVIKRKDQQSNQNVAACVADDVVDGFS